jgi:hypothetical protein
MKNIQKYNKYFKDYNNSSKYKLGKTYKYNLEKSYIKLYYNDDRIVFQTPALYIPYKPHINTYNNKHNYTVDMSFFNEGIDKALPEYEKWFYDLEKTVYTLLKKRSYLHCNKSNFRTLFKGDDYRYTKKMSISFSDKETEFYLLENVGGISLSKPIDKIVFPCYGFFIMEIQTIWINKPTNTFSNIKQKAPDWGIKLIIHAVQCVPNHTKFNKFNNINFIKSNTFNISKLNNNTNTTNTTLLTEEKKPVKSEIPEYLQTYFKMVKLGIARPAIKQKMVMSGLDPNLLDKTVFKTNISVNSDVNSDVNSGNKFMKITANILSSINLKKTDKEDPEERRKRLAKDKIKAIGGKGFAVSLDDILSISRKLKKTGTDTTKKIEKEINKKYMYNNNFSSNDEDSDFSDSDNEEVNC